MHYRTRIADGKCNRDKYFAFARDLIRAFEQPLLFEKQ